MMLNHTMATGVAISRLLDDVDVAGQNEYVAQEIAEYAELARVRLHLDNAAVTAAMMFAQPLVEMWKPQWKFAYTIGLSLGAKFTTEGFFIVDIIDHLTDEFSMEALKEGERIAVASYDWVAMNQRLRVFRNALVSVALEQPLAPSGMLPILMQPETRRCTCSSSMTRKLCASCIGGSWSSSGQTCGSIPAGASRLRAHIYGDARRGASTSPYACST